MWQICDQNRRRFLLSINGIALASLVAIVALGAMSWAEMSKSLNHWALSGDWTVKSDRTMSNNAGYLTNRFHARDLQLVMGPSIAGKPVRFRVRIDGLAPGAAHGTDIDPQGNGTLSEQCM